jgi:hypothetical protein
MIKLKIIIIIIINKLKKKLLLSNKNHKYFLKRLKNIRIWVDKLNIIKKF